MKPCLVAFFFYLCHFTSVAAVILQYHHVSDDTPVSTSISPAQFEKHLQYLKDNGFIVVPLSEVIEGVKNQQALVDKRVVITFDDAYLDVLEQAKPLLDKFSFPYSIFVNPGIINREQKNKSSRYLSWQQLRGLANEGVIMGNHGLEHNSLIRIPSELSEQQWLMQQGKLLLAAEKMIKEHTGQSWRYYAYPYGEYSPAIQDWIKKHQFVAFSQQSGAVGMSTDLTSVPRFPVSQPYDKISSLRDKLNSLPFAISLPGGHGETLFEYQQAKGITFAVETEDFYQSQLNCYISGLGRQKITWYGDSRFSIEFTKDLPTGRVRCNCTAPSISKPGRYYWYSKPWFILKPDGNWYHL